MVAPRHPAQPSCPKKAQPKSRIFEVGAGNSYGNPTSATLGRLAQVGPAVYRTDLNGDVTVTTAGSTYDVKTGRQAAPRLGILQQLLLRSRR